MKLLVGCPIRERPWAVNYWFCGVELACAAANVTPAYIFVADPRDEPTVSLLRETCEALDRQLYMIWTEEDLLQSDLGHGWNEARYARMVELRNQLLKSVRYLEPEMFLSCDSDIFLNERSLMEMMALLEGPGAYGAVSSKVHLHPRRTDAPNYAMLPPNGGLARQNATGTLTVDVIMALKLMTPGAYAVDYEHHPQGEDIGWSIGCRRRKVKLGWTGDVTSKHAMSPDAANEFDSRCGF